MQPQPPPGRPNPPQQSYPQQQGTQQQSYPQQQGTRPPKHRPNVKALAIVGTIFGLVVLAVVVVGVLLYRDYQETFGIHEPPNADHLTAYPTGEPPYAVGRYANLDGTTPDGTRTYTTRDQVKLTFREMPREYWDQMAVGDWWADDGDLLHDTTSDQYLLAFTDRTLLIQPDDAVPKEELLATLDGFLAVKGGEEPDRGWGSVEPPNVSDLPSLADQQSALPEAFGASPEHEGGQAQLLWSTSYREVYFVQAWTLDMWKYQTAGAEFTADGPVLCTSSDDRTTCLLAGSDAVVVASGYEQDAAELVRILKALL